MSGSAQPQMNHQVPDPAAFQRSLESFRLPTGETLAQASQSRMLVLVFLRHFGCTFTRQILRGLEQLEKQALSRGAELVLVHMLQDGGETDYMSSQHTRILRVADPDCDLYRAFGLGRGRFLELFGPRVWWLGMLSVFKGCGVGRFAGDGLQMPGVFLLHHGEILAAKPAKSASDLPDLPALFAAVPPSTSSNQSTSHP
jgi:hypothetical protein